jgi:fructose-1,6-bisphosphatase I
LKSISQKNDICDLKLINYNDFGMEERNKTLGEFIIENAFQYSSGELSRIINSIRLAAKVVNYKVNKAGLVDIVSCRRAKYSR